MTEDRRLYALLFQLESALLLLFLSAVGAAVLAGTGGSFARCWGCFLPGGLVLPGSVLARRRWDHPAPLLLAGVSLGVLSAAGGLLLMNHWAVWTAPGTVVMLLVSVLAAVCCVLLSREQALLRFLLTAVLAFAALFLRRGAPVWEQAVLGTAAALIPLTAFGMLYLGTLLTDEFVPSASLRRGGRRLLAVFLAGMLTLTAALCGVWLLLPKPGPAAEPEYEPTSGVPYILDDLDVDRAKLIRVAFTALGVLAVAGGAVSAVRALVRRWLRRSGAQLPWNRPERADAGEPGRPMGFAPWLRRTVRRTLKRLRPREKLDETASGREQLRFVYRQFLRERAPDQPEILCRTPEEALGEGEFASLYNAARYDDRPLDASAREQAQRFYHTLGKKRI